MEIIKDTVEFRIPEPTAVAIGKFDGLHLGHKALLNELLKAKSYGLKAAVFTFDPSPGVYFSAMRGSISYRELMTREEKRESFEKLGIDYLVEYPFGAETAAVTPSQYVKQYLLEKMNAHLIAAGDDISFGKGGAGDAKLLKEIVEEAFLHKAGVMPCAEAASGNESIIQHVVIIPKIELNNIPISSSVVRRMAETGDMEAVSGMLGEDYCISGKVMHGNHLGKDLGMPTANLYPSDRKLLPPKGVYFSEVSFNDIQSEDDRLMQSYPAVTNIGIRPTVRNDYVTQKKGSVNLHETQLSVETHILGFDMDIYGRQIAVRLKHFHRHEKRFENIDELKEQMKADVRARACYSPDNCMQPIP